MSESNTSREFGRMDLDIAAWIYRDGEAITRVPENTALGACAIAEAFGANAVVTYMPRSGSLRFYTRRRNTPEWKRATIESFAKRAPNAVKEKPDWT